MKKTTLIPIILTQVAFLLAGAFLVLNRTNKVMEVKANDDASTTGVFVEVTDPTNNLSVNDRIIIVGTDFEGNYPVAFQELSQDGTSILATSMTASNARLFTDNHGNKSYLINNSYAEIFTVSHGLDLGSFVFKGTSSFSGYIRDVPDTTKIEDSSTKDEYSTWIIEPDTIDHNGNFLRNNGTGNHFYNTNGGSFSHSGFYKSYIHIYKQVSYSLETKIDPNRLDYYVYDPIDYSGLVTTVSYNDGTNNCKIDVSYDECSGIFNCPSVISPVFAANRQVDFTVIGKTANFRPTMHDRNQTLSYSKVTSLNDFRGTYHFVTENGGKVFNPFELNYHDVGFIDVTISNHSIDAASTNYHYSHNETVIRVVRETISNEIVHYLKTTTGKYLSFNNYDTELLLTNQPSSKVLFEPNGDIKLQGNHGTYTLYFYSDPNNAVSSHFEFSDTNKHGETNYYPVYLYRRDMDNDLRSYIDAFKTLFFNTTSVCDASGVQNKITIEAWANLATNFNSTAPDVREDLQGYFANLTYTHRSESLGYDEDVVDRYDYIISKYNLDDFMGRKIAGTYQNNFNPNANANGVAYINTIIGNDSNSGIIVIAIAAILVTSVIGFCFFTKKRQ